MRCYNGCPDSEYQALIDSCTVARGALLALGYTATYFPMEERYMAFKGHRPASPFFVTIHSLADYLLSPQQGATP